jgi:glycosyltransferase involved in cell wall biosynthesis
MAILSMATLRDPDAVMVRVGYLIPWKRALVSDLCALGVAVECLGRGRRGGYSWLYRLRQLLIQEPVDIVHSHTPSIAAAVRLVRLTLPPHARPRLISTDHNVWGAYRTLTKIAYRVTFHLDDAHIAVSEGVRSSFPRSLQSTQQVVRFGVPIDRQETAGASASSRAVLGIEEGETLVVTVANLRREKGYPDLLRAAAIVIEGHPAVRFLAAGQGPMDALLRQTHIDYGLGERFVFLGYRDNVRELLVAADLFVLASHKEGLPLAMLEAMSLGTPIVATTVGGITEVVTHGREGLLIEPHRPRELARAIETLLSDPARRQRMGQAARERSRSFDMQITARRLGEIHSGLLA